MSIYIYACVTTQDWGIAGRMQRPVSGHAVAGPGCATHFVYELHEANDDLAWLCSNIFGDLFAGRLADWTFCSACARWCPRSARRMRARTGSNHSTRGPPRRPSGSRTRRCSASRGRSARWARPPPRPTPLAPAGVCWATTRARGRQSWRTCARRACICTTCTAAIDMRLLRQEADAAHAHAHARLSNTSSLHGTARDSRPRARLHRRAPGLPARAHLAQTAAGAI